MTDLWCMDCGKVIGIEPVRCGACGSHDHQKVDALEVQVLELEHDLRKETEKHQALLNRMDNLCLALRLRHSINAGQIEQLIKAGDTIVRLT